ncbi:polar amino acid transport system permease protein [Streptosporangium subroseum]|uniref:Polar amino acid transport system permease protein n=1 Tax=Streptosporangium subroseum TaxID=106412 RepID=A0A239BR92_9ACTN|nr:amino acid ABC transporter permease [Streptosporangium subroseum]SNS10159.1 polar amino acid transport system permease protein [Streptosporangium subroseum]
MTDQSTTAESPGPAGAPPGRTKLSPRKKQQISRAVQYVVLVVVAVFLVTRIEWGSLAQNFAKSEVASQMLPDLFTVALLNTIIYSVGGFVFAFLLGLLFALMRLSSVRPYRWIAVVYIEIFRGLPAVLIFLFILFLPLALPGFEVPGGTYGQGILGLTVVGSAYMAETLRAGLQAVPKGQLEAARSLGMSYSRGMISIVIPQAVRIVIPPTTNQFVSLLKDSSLVLFLGVSGEYVELTKFGNDTASTFANATPLLVVGVTYLLVTIPLGYLASRLEKRQMKGR